jgi:hypothetical protein
MQWENTGGFAGREGSHAVTNRFVPCSQPLPEAKFHPLSPQWTSTIDLRLVTFGKC